MLRSLAFIGLLATPALAQDALPPNVIITTADQVLALGQEVDRLVAADDCEGALRQLPAFITAANAYTNFIAAGLRPYEDFPPANRSSSGALADELSQADRRRARTIAQRNLAYVTAGDCLVKLDQKDAAAGAYLKALELLDGDEERETWQRARTGLWKLIGIIPQ